MDKKKSGKYYPNIQKPKSKVKNLFSELKQKKEKLSKEHDLFRVDKSRNSIKA
jgi:hypothetical protein